MELQVKEELQKADVKACCLHDQSDNEKQFVKANTVLYIEHLKLHEIDTAKMTN